jgi:hypothetical protein
MNQPRPRYEVIGIALLTLSLIPIHSAYAHGINILQPSAILRSVIVPTDKQVSSGSEQQIAQLARQLAIRNPAVWQLDIGQVLVSIAWQTAYQGGNSTDLINQIASRVEEEQYGGTLSLAIVDLAKVLHTGDIVAVDQAAAQVAEKVAKGENAIDVLKVLVNYGAVGPAINTKILLISDTVASKNPDSTKSEIMDPLIQYCLKSRDRPSTPSEFVTKGQDILKVQYLSGPQSSPVGQSFVEEYMNQVADQVERQPTGPIAQSLIHFGKQPGGNTNQAITEIVQKTSEGLPATLAVPQAAVESLGTSSTQNVGVIATQVANGLGINIGQITQTLQQIALKSANTNGTDTAQQTITQLADQVKENATGAVAKRLAYLSDLQAAGNIDDVNTVAMTLAKNVASGGNATNALTNVLTETVSSNQTSTLADVTGTSSVINPQSNMTNGNMTTTLQTPLVRNPQSNMTNGNMTTTLQTPLVRNPQSNMTTSSVSPAPTCDPKAYSGDPNACPNAQEPPAPTCDPKAYSGDPNACPNAQEPPAEKKSGGGAGGGDNQQSPAPAEKRSGGGAGGGDNQQSLP